MLSFTYLAHCFKREKPGFIPHEPKILFGVEAIRVCILVLAFDLKIETEDRPQPEQTAISNVFESTYKRYFS